MGFSRKFLKDILESLSSGESIDDAVDKIMTEHGTSVSDYKTKLSRYDDVDLEALKSSESELAGIRKKIGSLNLDSLITEHTTLNDTLKGRKLEDVIAENAKYHEEADKAKLNASIDALLTGYKFTSSAAERDIRSQIAALPRNSDGTSFVDADKIMPKLVADNSDAFVSSSMPKFTTPTKAGSSNAEDEQSVFLAKRYGGLIK